jgi:predicted nicotinamide N-methyase
MEQSGIDWHGKTVLELGAGTGLSGMVASALGRMMLRHDHISELKYTQFSGAHVTLTDRRLALDLLKLNVKQNRDYLDPSVRVAELNWGQNLDEFAAVSPQWDVIIGADIVYIEDTFDALLATLRQLCGQKTDIYLACKIRYDRDLKFLSLMEDYFQWKKTAYSEQNDVTLVHARLKEIILEEQQECSV